MTTQTKVRSTEEALKRIAAYPFSRAEELSVEQMREIAREALMSQSDGAQPEQEPVVTDWNAVHEKLELIWYRELSADEGLDEIQDLIDTTPYVATPRPQRKPLTDEQIAALWQQYNPLHGIASFARAIESTHGIKE